MIKLNITLDVKGEAEKWVSAFVLIGCILITMSLLYAAAQAEVLGERFTPASDLMHSN